MAKAKYYFTKLIKLTFFIIGVLLLFFLIRRVGLREIVKIISGARINFLIYGFIIYVMLMLTRAYKWCLLIRASGIEIKYKELLPSYFLNCLISNITPFKSGEAATPLILKKYLKIPMGKGFSVVIFDRFFELLIFTLIFALAVVYIINISIISGIVLSVFKWTLAGFIILISFLLLVITSPKIISKIISILKLFQKYQLIKKIIEFIERELQIFCDSLSLFKNKRVYQFMIPLTLISWFFEFLSFYLIFASVIPAAFLKVAVAQVIAIAATLITFIPGGIGVGELGAVYVLNLFDYSIILNTSGVLLARLILTGTLLTMGTIGTMLLKDRDK